MLRLCITRFWEINNVKFRRKKVKVDELKQVAEESLSAVVVDYRGTDVPKLTGFRKEAKDKSVFIKIIKNTLAKRALEDTKFDSLKDVLTGPSLIAFSKEDYQSAAKLIQDFAKKEESFEVKGLSIGEGLLSADLLNSIASLPTKDEAISMLLGLMKAPITNLALISKEIPSSMVRTLSAYGDSKNWVWFII